MMTDQQGEIKVTICPPGFARGIYPEPTARASFHPYNHTRPWNEEQAWAGLGVGRLQSLYRAVLMQLLCDLGSGSKGKHQLFAKLEAENFILGSSPRHLDELCDMADIDPNLVRTAAKDIMVNGMSWRAPAGKGKRYLERLKYRARFKVVGGEDGRKKSTSPLN